MDDRPRSEHALQILDVIARYAHAADSLRSDVWADVFADDGSLELYAPHDEGPNAIFEGRATIRSYLERQHTRPGGLRTRHIQSNTTFVSLGDDRAQTVTEFMILLKAPDAGPNVIASGIYEDRWRRTSRGWRIARRVVRAD